MEGDKHERQCVGLGRHRRGTEEVPGMRKKKVCEVTAEEQAAQMRSVIQ